MPGTAFTPKTVTLQANLPAATATAGGGRLEVVFRPDPSVYDGRFANNAWLQELPNSLTKLTWENAALIAPQTAEDLNLITRPGPNQDVPDRVPIVELRQGGRTIRTPVWLAPGQAPDTITLHVGYGRIRAGQIANGLGVDVNPLRTVASPDILTGVELVDIDETAQLASTQDHWALEGRNIIRETTVEEFDKDPTFAKKREHQPIDNKITMYPNYDYSQGYQWGMTIDQNVCTGCNSCVVACQAENNVPVVGKSQVLNGREMHWLRVDRYYTGELENPGTYHQPMPCQQCETAPCEVVCPVAATVHSAEGLNDMVYNRCVGTRYCSNNCPYKVRRFNFMLYADFNTPSLKLMRNPDVTVRSRGVMEKCTYCVQRINQARVAAKLEDREIRDGDVVTACQAACPTDAIVFGNINDPNSAVSRRKASPLNYPLLAELNTRPRTTYLAVVRNPNAELPDEFGIGCGRRALGMEQRESRAAATASAEAALLARTPAVIAPGHTFDSVTDTISHVVLTKRTPLGWFLGFFVALILLLILNMTIGHLLLTGIGIWGNNVPVGWAFDIINFVWWIGIGHAGTLISAILLLFRQQWRTSINRFAEAMTLFAVACAAMFPLLHTGRPWLAAYWLFPYPNTMGLWPQFRSPLIWDVFAVSTYGTVSALFWYAGLVPDLATLRDRAKSRIRAAHLRHARARLARIGQALAALRDGISAARRYLDAARALRAHDRELRLRGVGAAGVARDDLPAVLRRRRDLLRLRDGDDAGDSAAQVLRPRRLHHHAPHPQHGEGHAGHRDDRRLRLRERSVLRLVQRQPVRAVHDDQPHDRPVRRVLLVAHRDQRGDDPAVLVPQRARQPAAALHPLAVRERRHVARALHHHRHEPAPRLPALVVGHVCPDAVGLRHVRRHDRAVPGALLVVRPLPAGDRDLRDADDRARGKGESRTPRVM